MRTNNWKKHRALEFQNAKKIEETQTKERTKTTSSRREQWMHVICIRKETTQSVVDVIVVTLIFATRVTNDDHHNNNRDKPTDYRDRRRWTARDVSEKVKLPQPRLSYIRTNMNTEKRIITFLYFIVLFREMKLGKNV